MSLTSEQWPHREEQWVPSMSGTPVLSATRSPRPPCSSGSRRPAQPSLPTHRPLPRLKDHLFFQRFENDGQEWLSSESDIGEPSEPRARNGPKQETTALRTAELSAV